MRRIVDGRAVSGYGDGALGAATIGVTPGEEYSRIQKDGGGTRGGLYSQGTPLLPEPWLELPHIIDSQLERTRKETLNTDVRHANDIMWPMDWEVWGQSRSAPKCPSEVYS